MLPDPVGCQVQVLWLPTSGANVVLGAAGSGKSVIAAHTARYLSDPETINGGTVLLTTFTKTLVSELRRLLAKEPFEDRRQIATLDSLAWQINRAAMGRPPKPTGPFGARQWLSRAAESAAVTAGRSQLRVVERRGLEFVENETSWIASQGFETAGDYLGAERVGRTTPLNAEGRAEVWDVVERYRQIMDERGQWDYPHLRLKALEWLNQTPSADEHRFDHVVVDEGQDFGPSAIALLQQAVRPGGSFTFVADPAQQLYGNRISWRSLGLPSRAPFRCDQNLRNSRQIALLARELMAHNALEDVEDVRPPAEGLPVGDRPLLVVCAGREEERRVAVLELRRCPSAETVAFLSPRKADAEELASRDPRIHHLTADKPLQASTHRAFTATLHGSKGLTFDRVIMLHMSDVSRTELAWLAGLDEEEQRNRWARMLFVGVTRARRRLVVTCTGDVSDAFPPEAFEVTTFSDYVSAD